VAYAFSWIVGSPWVLGHDCAGLLPIRIPPPLAGYLNAAAILLGPTLAALIMTAATEGSVGVARLLGRFVLWRVGIQWHQFALLGIPLIMLLGTMVYSPYLNLAALGGPSYLLSYLTTYVLVLVLGGPLFEEPGWRGFVGSLASARIPGPILGRFLQWRWHQRHNLVHARRHHIHHRHNVGIQ
jgi:uncharacterized protein